MTILYAPFNSTTLGSSVVAPDQRQQGMHMPDFYQQQYRQRMPPEQQYQQYLQNQQAANADPNQQYGPGGQPTTLDYVYAQAQKMRQAPGSPQLNPGSRVRNVDTSIGAPSNFQGFYQQLGSIRQISQEQEMTAQAQAAVAQARASQQLNQFSAANPQYQTPMSSGGGGGSGGGNIGAAGSGISGSVPSNPRANFQFAQNIAGNYGWGSPQELAAWYQLGMKESGWNNNAQNPTSTAYGIGQFLNSTWGGYGIPKTADPAQQVEAMARYIKARYGSPSKALSFHISHNWY